MLLRGKTAVITGGTRGIGRAICETFAAEGANIAFLYASSGEKAESLCSVLGERGIKARAYRCNVADAADAAAACKEILCDFGTVDILVNNAGITRDKLVLSMRERDFDEVLAVNLKGAFNMIHQVCPIFVKKHAGKIINISSIAGLVGNAGQANYAASKAGLIGITKSVAKELASRGINCNAVAPGVIETDMTVTMEEGNPIVASIPLGRRGKPEEVARLALFLASDASDYITGEVIRCDGGLAM